jgi:DNA-binding NarL/FixJ family response regulator
MLNRPSVAIVEDHLLLAETLLVALGQRSIDAAILVPERMDQLQAELLARAPDLVLLDLDLAQLGDSTEIIEPLTAAGIPVLVVTGVTERLRIAAAIERGAVGYQLKALGFDALVATVSALLAGQPVADPADRADLLQELSRATAERERAISSYTKLTEREQGTLRALGDGRSVHEIAGDWVVSESTVRSHVRGVLVKLGVASQLAAVAEARRNGWLTPLAERRVPISRP